MYGFLNFNLPTCSLLLKASKSYLSALGTAMPCLTDGRHPMSMPLAHEARMLAGFVAPRDRRSDFKLLGDICTNATQSNSKSDPCRLHKVGAAPVPNGQGTTDTAGSG